MSTGLTYVLVIDPNGSSNPTGSGSFIFGVYDEAYDYGRWLNDIYPVGVVVTIYTTSPNQSGYWYENVFTPVD